MGKNRSKAVLKNSRLEYITSGVHFGSASGVIFEVTKESVEPDAVHKNISGKKWASWGADNDLPQRISDRNGQDPVSSNAIEFKIKAHYGKGLMPFIKIKDGNKIIKSPILLEDYPELEDFYHINDLENYAQGVATDYEWCNNCYTEYILNKTGNKIIRIERKPANFIRAEKKNPKTGLIEGYYLSGNWPSPQEGEYVRIPAFNRNDPFQYQKSIFWHTKPSFDKVYYHAPSWYSNAKALEVSSEIFTWILANLKNSLNIKYHVKIPQDYFTSLFRQEDYDTAAEWQLAMIEHEIDLMAKMDEMLSGSKNVSKTFYSKFALDEAGKPLPGWEIVPIENKTNHEAFLPAYNTAAMAVSTAHTVDPTMTGIQLATGATGSGSDVREKFNAYVQLHTVIPRQTSMEGINVPSHINGFKAEGRLVHWTYEDIILNTIDVNKSGFTTETEPTPTSINK